MKVHLDTLIGNEIMHSQLPKKFQSHCPPEYQAHVARVVDETVSHSNSRSMNMGKYVDQPTEITKVSNIYISYLCN